MADTIIKNKSSLTLITNDVKEDILNPVIFSGSKKENGTSQHSRYENKTFKGNVHIRGDWFVSLIFHNCNFENVIIDEDNIKDNLIFKECRIKRITFHSGKVGNLFIQECHRIDFIDFSENSIIKILQIHHFTKIENVSIRSRINHLHIWGRSTNSSEIKSLSLILDQIQNTKLDTFNSEKLVVSNSSIDNSQSINHLKIDKLTFSEFSTSKAKIVGCSAKHGSKQNLTITNSDLSNSSFHSCQFNGLGTIYNSKLQGLSSLGTKWPMEYYGDASRLRSTYRELKIMFRNQGDYRFQLDFYKREMQAFKSEEWNRLKETSGFSNPIQDSVDYFIRVWIPYKISNFGLATWKPLGLYLIGLIITINTLLIFQRQEMGIVYNISWPWSWNWSLFWHLILPTHSPNLNGTLLIPGVDVSWRIISTLLLYHIIISSRKLININ